jgi:1,4-alpha-glucan branching enzyme
MSTGTTVEYAVNRTKQHIFRFNQLYEALYKGEIDEACLGYYEWIDGIFSDPDYRLYALR